MEQERAQEGFVIRYCNRGIYKGLDEYLYVINFNLKLSSKTADVSKATIVVSEDEARRVVERFPTMDDYHHPADIVPISVKASYVLHTHKSFVP